MIPLNKPGDITKFQRNTQFAQALTDKQHQWLFTAGDGLNLIYQQLYHQFGSLRVAVSPLTCYQAILPITMNGHIPVLVDIDANTLNINPTQIPSDVDVIEVIHLGGNPVDMDLIEDCRLKIEDYNHKKIWVIEDCAQAMGAKWKGKYTGTFGHYAVYSILKNLYQPAGLITGDRLMAIGEKGNNVGMAVKTYKVIKTWLEQRASYMPSVANILYKTLLTLRDQEGGFKNIVRRVGDNLSTLENSLQYIEALNEKRKANAQRIISAIDPQKFTIQCVPEGGESSWNRILVRALTRPACDIIKELRAAGIAANNLTQSYIHPWQEPVWNNPQLAQYYHADTLPVYTQTAPQVVAIPNSPFLSEKEIAYICKTINTL